MAYYFMRCVHCLSRLINEEILFDAGDSFISAESLLSGGSPANGPVDARASEQEGRPAAGAALSQFEQIFSDQADPESPKPLARDGRFGLVNCATLFKQYEAAYHVPAIPEAEQEGPDVVSGAPGVLTQIQFTDESGRKKFTGARYCPHCGNPIPPQSGMIPTFAILFLGASSAGKTVYISTINYFMLRTIALPGNRYIQALPAGNNEAFHNMTLNLFNDGVLPGTTAIDLPDPLTLEVRLHDQGKAQKKCLICFVDMRGEDMLTHGRLIARSSLIKRADAFLMAIDPLSIDQIAWNLTGDVAREERGSGMADAMAHTKILQHISEEILPTLAAGIITPPSVIMMTKMDKVINNRHSLQLVKNSHLTVNPNVRSTYDRDYFINMGRSSEELFCRADFSLYNGIRGCFRNPYFSTVSALGCNARIGTVANQVCVTNGPRFIKPIRVMDPVIFLLIKLGFLPVMELDPNEARQGQVTIK